MGLAQILEMVESVLVAWHFHLERRTRLVECLGSVAPCASNTVLFACDLGLFYAGFASSSTFRSLLLLCPQSLGDAGRVL